MLEEQLQGQVQSKERRHVKQERKGLSGDESFELQRLEEKRRGDVMGSVQTEQIEDPSVRLCDVGVWREFKEPLDLLDGKEIEQESLLDHIVPADDFHLEVDKSHPAIRS